MQISKKELNQIILEELTGLLDEIAQPKDINWEVVGKNYLKALFHKEDINYNEAKRIVNDEVKAARDTPGGLEALRAKVQKELDIDIMEKAG
tara:strand:+ start:386 stop:661 length:276 start_codon:yes stop_codon:yes gene_type:complete